MYYYEISESELFSPVRHKRDVLGNLFKMIRCSNWMNYKETFPLESDYFAYDCCLGRAFLRVGNSIHSFGFPFTLEADEGARHVYARWRGFTIDSAVASLAITVFDEPGSPFTNLEEKVLEAACDYYSDESIDLDAVVIMLSYLSNLDDGYFRQDEDSEHVDGRIHPENHIDLYYADRISVKLGLLTPLTICSLRDFASKEKIAFTLNGPIG